MASRLAHLTRGDIRIEFSTAVSQMAATILIASENVYSPGFPSASDVQRATIAACDLFDAVGTELALRINLEIDEANRQLEETLGSISKGGES